MDFPRDPEQARSQSVERKDRKTIAIDGRGANGLLVLHIWRWLFSNNAV
jgi:hypothetical protein